MNILIYAGNFQIKLALFDTHEFGIGFFVFHGIEVDSEIGWTSVQNYNLSFFFGHFSVKHVIEVEEPE